MKSLHNKVNAEVLKAQVLSDSIERITLSFYQYASIPNPNFFRDHLYILFEKVGVLGRIYIATEGVNGQLSVPKDSYPAFNEAMSTIDFLNGIRHNIAIEDDGKSFFKLNIKVRPKIVADGLNDETFDASDNGVHLNAKEFNEITSSNDTVIVDMRNHYESEVGHFKNAITPDVETFRESLPIVKDLLEEHKEKHIVMYCTGGIRCEKASAYLKHQGFEKVYQLDGGIIEYARQAEKENLENKFIGKNFVFDDRMGERISEEVISKCHQCGNPSDKHVNCANDACHILFIQCETCSTSNNGCCSAKCKDFNALPEEERKMLKGTTTFNGTKFGKGRYKAHRKDHNLED